MRSMPSIHDLRAVESLCRRHKLDPNRLRALRNAFYKRHRPFDQALREIALPEREAIARQVAFHVLRLDARHDSRRDGTTKLVFRTEQDLLLETVILRMTSGRTALCVSTQVGCAANCQFCATGKMGIAKNLSMAEMLDQLIQANALLATERRKVRNLVFMGMGEPFHNEEQLFAAIDVLCDRACFDLNPSRLLISTVGIPQAMVRCVRRYPDVRQALSLHSARQEVRESLMPIARRHPLAELRQVLVEVAAVGGHPIMIEYLMLKDVTDSLADAQALADYLRGIPVHVNLIPYNPIADAPHLQASEPARRAEFSAVLKAAGLPVTTRYSLGADIAAACGQLARDEHRRRAAVSG